MTELSIRWRITIWNTVAFAVILLGFGVSVFALLRHTHYDQIDRSLQKRFNEIVDRQGLGGGRDASEWLAGIGSGQAGYIVGADGEVIASTGEALASELTAIAASAGNAPRFDSNQLTNLGHVRYLSARMPNAKPPLTLLLVAELEHTDEELAQVIRALLVTAPITLIAAACLAYLLAYKALAPVDGLRRMTDEITAQRLDRRLPVQNAGDELGLLAQTVNFMIARLQHSFSEIRRFTADASHELRTPLAVIRSEAELGLADAKQHAAAQRRFESIIEECARLAELTTQLLTLCREDAGIVQPSHQPLQLRAIISDATESLRPLADAKQQQLAFIAQHDVVVQGDPDRLRRVFCNLIDNAVKFTPADGSVTVSLRRRHDEAEITIQDSGIGISPEHLPHVFDRFYQVAAGRSGASGAGLGLSIVKSIVEAHHGRVTVTSEPDSGTALCVCLPIVSIAELPVGAQQIERTPAEFQIKQEF